MQSVSVRQVWSVLDRNRLRVEFVVHRIGRDGTTEERAFGIIVSNGKEISFAVAALSKGMRGSRLLRHADGHEPYRPPPDKLTQTAEETKTASDYKRVAKPKGLATAAPHMEKAYKMRFEQKIPLTKVAKFFEVTPNRVSDWCKRYREKLEDLRNLEEV